MSATVQRDYANHAASTLESWAPHTTLIMACFRVGEYLPVFLASLDAQTADHRDYELVFVIDGCPEDSEDVVARWAERTDFVVRIIVQENGGVASARNTGLRAARGRWVSSPDPDDRLDDEYLARIAEARSAAPGVDMVVGRIQLRDPQGRAIPHPLDGKFRDARRRVVDLGVDADADDIQTLGGSVFFSTERIREHDLRVHEGLPTASDADFIMRYLVATGARYLLVPDAIYHYQRRADDSSIVKRQERNIERFTVVFGETHRALLLSTTGECPRWLANTLLYFTSYLFRRNLQAQSPVYDTPAETLAIIDAELRRNLQLIGATHITAFRIVALPHEIRMAWIAAATNQRFTQTPVHALGSPRPAGRRHLALYLPLGSEVPAIETTARVVDQKVREVEFLGAPWVQQVVLIMQSAEAPHVLNVAGMELSGNDDDPGVAPGTEPRRLGVIGRVRRASYAIPLRIAGLTGASRRLAGVRVIDPSGVPAGPLAAAALNALPAEGATFWVVRDPGLPATSLPNGMRSVRRGSRAHFILMKHAAWLVAASLDGRVQQPFTRDVLEPTWQRAHVVTGALGAHDFRALNPLPVELLVVPTESERVEVTASGSRYRFAGSEVRSASSRGSSSGEV